MLRMISTLRGSRERPSGDCDSLPERVGYHYFMKKKTTKPWALPLAAAAAGASMFTLALVVTTPPDVEADTLTAALTNYRLPTERQPLFPNNRTNIPTTEGTTVAPTTDFVSVEEEGGSKIRYPKAVPLPKRPSSCATFNLVCKYKEQASERAEIKKINERWSTCVKSGGEPSFTLRSGNSGFECGKKPSTRKGGAQQ